MEPPLVRLTHLPEPDAWDDALADVWPAIRAAVADYEDAPTDGRHGAGILLAVLVGTERIFACIGLLEVPAAVDVFTKTGQARLYSDLMRPEADQ